MKDNQGFHIYINEKAGTVDQMGRSALETLINESDLPVEQIYFLAPDTLLQKVEQDDGVHPILIGGGDGTIKSCAALFIDTKRSFGILPFGTMNLLAKDLGIPSDIHDVLALYARGTNIHEIDVGRVNSEIFLCCTGLGTMPETSRYRERLRGDSEPIMIPRLTAYVLRKMDRLNRKKLTLTLDGRLEKIKTAALVVSNNQYGDQGQWTEENFKRTSLQDGIFGVYSAAPYSIWDKLRLLFRLRVGDWKKDEALQEWQCRTLCVQSKESSVLLSLDGETQRFATPLKFSILPKHLKLLVPKERSS